MTTTAFSKNIITTAATVKEAMARINSLSGDGVMTLLVTDSEGHMAGTLTDGDVRRALLAGVPLSDSVTRAMNGSFKSLSAGDIDLHALRRFRASGITLIPVLGPDGTIEGIIDTRHTHTLLPLQALLMAGGKGERLRPLTADCPKPLLPVGDRPIIDYNIQALARVGITDVTVTVNYLAHMLEEHFASPVAGINVKCVRENAPLGTIGAASLVELAKGGDTLVMNSDLLTDISLEDMYMHHVAEQADITIAAVPYTVSVPYAIMDTDGFKVGGLDEKPTYTYYANGGIYIFSNEILASIPADTRTDAPDLIGRAIAGGKRVVYFPINGTWIDIGSPADYAHACEIMKLNSLIR